jgi:type IV secretion system protein VirB1
MVMELDIDYLIQTCSYDVGAKTMTAIIETESSGNPWIINDNNGKQIFKLKTKEEAISKAKELINNGSNIDLGLAQINSSNLLKLKLSVNEVFDPCTNIKAGSTILRNFYLQSKQKFSGEQHALFYALSAYNTGSFYSGIDYAKKVWHKAHGNITVYSKTIYPGNYSPYKAPIIVDWKSL